jgi:hypothetical protein
MIDLFREVIIELQEKVGFEFIVTHVQIPVVFLQ